LFQFVLADGNCRTIHWTANGITSEDDQIYWGFLRGGPGCLGVLTKIVFECIHDADHKKLFSYNRILIFKEPVFLAIMNQVADWMDKLHNDPKTLTLWL